MQAPRHAPETRARDRAPPAPRGSPAGARALEALRGVAAVVFLVLNTLFWFVPIGVFGAVRRLARGSVRAACGALLDRFLTGWVACAEAMARVLRMTRLRVEVEPSATPLRKDAWYLVISNHQSWADILVLVWALRRRAPAFKFFTKRELIWLPLVGVALWLLDFPYVRRYGRERLQADPSLRERDARAVRVACVAIRERPVCVLNFLEGTRFSPAKRVAQGSPYEALLVPKVGGLQLVRDGLAERLSAVLDTTIHYPGGAPGFWDFLCGRRTRIDIHIRALPPPQGDRDALRRWVDQLWRAKDERLRAVNAKCNPRRR